MKADYKKQKKQEAQGQISAGAASNLLSKGGMKTMPTTKGYSDAAKVYSPASRSI